MSAAPRSARTDDTFTHAEIKHYYSVRAPRVRQAGAEWRGPCPIHKGVRDSFAVDPETGAWTCHSECGRGGSIYDFEMAISSVDFKRAAAEVRQFVGRASGTRSASKLGRAIAEYDYTDEAGNPLFQCVRFDPKDFRQRQPDGRGGWVWNLKGARLVLYHLPKIAHAQSVCIVEGEKDVHALEGLGFTATCNPMGAGKWRDEYAEQLRGKDVVIFPDNDEPGRKHADQITRSLMGKARSIKTVPVPVGKDVSDWIAAGATPEMIHEAIAAAEPARIEQPKVVQMPAASAAPTKRYGWHDTGNGNRLADAHGADLIYCEERRGFMVWTGTHWAPDDFVRVETLAEKTLLAAYAEVGEYDDPEERKGFLKFLKQSLQRGGISNMVHSTKRKVTLARINDFDFEPYLLNCTSGTLDLQTGKLAAHRRENRISRVIPYAYDPAAECPTFLAFLYRIMGSDPDASEGENERAARLVEYLQRAFGCAATGKPEKVLFVFYGTGNNGKTTLLEIIRAALGDDQYAGEVQIETLMTKPKDAAGSNTINADLADLKGCRFVSSSEVEQGQRLSLSRVKYITGLSQIKARRLHENHFTFKPTHKVFLDCNHKPVISDPNDAVWNRVKLIPFTVTIPKGEIDTDLPRKLRAELPGILRWIVEGARAYLRDGLRDIPEVMAATEQYRQESDRLAEFIEDRCIVNPNDKNVWVPVARLWEAYQQWAEETGEKFPLGKTLFDERIERLGCKKGKNPEGTQRAWKGIRFRS